MNKKLTIYQSSLKMRPVREMISLNGLRVKQTRELNKLTQTELALTAALKVFSKAATGIPHPGQFPNPVVFYR